MGGRSQTYQKSPQMEALFSLQFLKTKKLWPFGRSKRGYVQKAWSYDFLELEDQSFFYQQGGFGFLYCGSLLLFTWWCEKLEGPPPLQLVDLCLSLIHWCWHVGLLSTKFTTNTHTHTHNICTNSKHVVSMRSMILTPYLTQKGSERIVYDQIYIMCI